MCKRLITTVVWLLLLAVPFQGYAAVAMLVGHPCGTLQTASSASKHTHGLDSTHQPHHAVSAVANDHSHAPTGVMTADHHGDAGTDHGGPFKCSNCASCCLGSIITASLAPMPSAQPASSERIPFEPRHVTAHISPGLERPPLLRFI